MGARVRKLIVSRLWFSAFSIIEGSLLITVEVNQDQKFARSIPGRLSKLEAKSVRGK